jgi:hypothetical protein
MAMALTKCSYDVDPEVRQAITFPRHVQILPEDIQPYNSCERAVFSFSSSTCRDRKIPIAAAAVRYPQDIALYAGMNSTNGFTRQRFKQMQSCIACSRTILPVILPNFLAELLFAGAKMS